MPDDRYESDVLAWSEHQADLVRRLARDERVNDVDREHVAEEIEGVGLSELHAIESYLELMLVHQLWAQAWLDSKALNHWHGEIVALQNDATRRFAPSMRRRLDVTRLYQAATEQVSAANGGQRSANWPLACPFRLDQLLTDKWDVLKATVTAASAA